MPGGERGGPGGLPLQEWTVAITRPEGQGEALARKVEALGGRAWLAPLLAIDRFPDRLLPAIRRWNDWDALVITSANAARALAEALEAEGRTEAPRPVACYAVGRASATALGRAGLVAEVPEGVRTGADLADVLARRWAGRHLRVLYIHGELADPNFSARLAEAGVDVTAVCAYRTREAVADVAAWRRLLAASPQLAVTLYSPSAVRAWIRQLQPLLLESGRKAAFVCVGPTTARAAREAGLADVWLAPASHDDGVAEALAALAAARSHHKPQRDEEGERT
ncbi:uroporphyrinogen-III synthase [Alicyclobacillus macrosporangiidus]|uniref:uroporphyrinogen-III synthase n=1 Tax=Alicyclobacillus macrosporangiidus TaxID=392015 RepID=UPI000497F0AB|nr:uroporphyrinogen-III synthase [Alicyclobacillus macrosporangiidus]